MNESIKMFIAGEEVVSNNDFTINEEMLSASSTILNNCYPKSWELTKDYVSNFYYPKDYSRFVLAQGEYLHGNQEFAPLEITGKNLFDANSGTIGYITNSGTVGSDSSNYASDYIYLGQNTDFTISSNTTLNNIGIAFFDNNKNIILPRIDNYGKQTVIKNTGSAYYVRFWVQKTGQTMSADLVISYQVQLELGNQATSFESYYQPNLSYETNVEKVWNTFNVYGRTYQATRSGKNLCKPIATAEKSGITFTNNNDGSYTLNGTATAGTSFYITGLNYPAGTYTLSANNAVSINNGSFYIQVEYQGGGTDRQPFTQTNIQKTFTSTKTITVWSVVVPSGIVLNNFVIKPQLELGSTATYFEAYGVSPSPDYPSELVSVGYQNLFDKNNANVINGYLSGSLKIVAANDDRVVYIPCKPNTIYTVSKMVEATTANNRFGLGTTTTLPQANTTLVDFTYLGNGTTATQFSIKTGNTAKYLVCGIYHIDSSTTFDDMKASIQIEESPIAHSYIPYGKYGIEIANTGKNLLDGIFRQGNVNGNISVATQIFDDSNYFVVKIQIILFQQI